MCQYFVQQPLQIIHRIVPQLITCHYMDDILCTDSDTGPLEKMFKETQRILPWWGLQIAPEKRQRGDSINYLGYKICQQKIQPQKVPIYSDQLQTVNNFQKLMGDINWLRPTTRLGTYKLSNSFQTLQGD